MTIIIEFSVLCDKWSKTKINVKMAASVKTVVNAETDV